MQQMYIPVECSILTNTVKKEKEKWDTIKAINKHHEVVMIFFFPLKNQLVFVFCSFHRSITIYSMWKRTVLTLEPYSNVLAHPFLT